MGNLDAWTRRGLVLLIARKGPHSPPALGRWWARVPGWEGTLPRMQWKGPQDGNRVRVHWKGPRNLQSLWVEIPLPDNTTPAGGMYLMQVDQSDETKSQITGGSYKCRRSRNAEAATGTSGLPLPVSHAPRCLGSNARQFDIVPCPLAQSGSTGFPPCPCTVCLSSSVLGTGDSPRAHLPAPTLPPQAFWRRGLSPPPVPASCSPLLPTW